MNGMDLGRLSTELFQGFLIDGDGLVQALQEGDFGRMIQIFSEAIKDTTGQPVQYVREYMITLFLLGIGAAVLKQTGYLFQDPAAGKMGFWIIYLLLSMQLLALYYNGEEVARRCLTDITSFGNVFIPVFSVVLVFASGSMTGTGYVATFMFIIYVIERFLLMLMLPCVEGYMLLSLLGSLWERDRVEKLMNLLEKGLALGFKLVFIALMGIGVLQSMLLPYADSVKSGAFKKLAGLIPGVGKAAEGSIEMAAGAAVLLKNGIGIIGILLILLAAAVPMLKIGLLCIVMKTAASIYGLLGDKQMTWCADKMGTAGGYLWKITGTGVVLCILWIVLAVYTTNQRAVF